MTCIEVGVIGQKLPITLKSKDLAILAFKIKFKTHSPKPAEVEPSFRKVSLLPAKLRIRFSLLTFGLESFGHKSIPSHRPWVEPYCPKF